MNLAEKIRVLLCDWTHGGGRIVRDDLGRINWRCNKCGRWADPVPLDEEKKVLGL